MVPRANRQKQRLFVGGPTEDACARATVLDALREGFEVVVLGGATRPVDPDDGRRAREEMRAADARLDDGSWLGSATRPGHFADGAREARFSAFRRVLPASAAVRGPLPAVDAP